MLTCLPLIILLTVVLLPCRSVADGDLWSLALGDYIHINNLVETHCAKLRKLFCSTDRFLLCLETQFHSIIIVSSHRFSWSYIENLFFFFVCSGCCQVLKAD